MGDPCCQSCASLFRQMTIAAFVAHDAKLYLDTHPCDQEALECYDRFRNTYNQIERQYNEQCGPMTSGQVNIQDGWTWTAAPWPWEGVM